MHSPWGPSRMAVLTMTDPHYHGHRQQLAAADPAGGRKGWGVWPARMPESGRGVARAARQLSSRPLGACRFIP